MSFSPDNLLQQLDQPEIIDWALELKNRDDSYCFLIQKLSGGQLNLNQTKNALHALFRIGYSEHGVDILKIFLMFANNSNKSIRSEAVQLAVGLIKWTLKWQQIPLLVSDEQMVMLRKSLELGLSVKVAKILGEFLENTTA